MVSHVVVQLSQNPYEILVESGLLDRAGELIAGKLAPGKCGLVTDSRVGPLYAERTQASLERAGFSVTSITVPAGEQSKSLAVVEAICDQMIAAGMDRRTSVVALGGGVVGDLAGFVASIYYRGIPHVQIPTTVVAQVDSAIGGKTGVNAQGGKNLIGSFHQPALVLSDPSVLRTLPEREFNEGVAEIIKHAVIRDAEMLDNLEESVSRALPELIVRNVRIKAAIVAEDEFETRGVRALLNFGHTIGHALENAAGYGRLLHGEAISLGIAAALDLSVRKAGLSPGDAKRVLQALRSFVLPVSLPGEIAPNAVLEAMKTDKKFESGAIRFVLTGGLGSAFVSREVTESDIRSALEALRSDPNDRFPAGD